MSIHIENLLHDLLNTPAERTLGKSLWIADESLNESELLAVQPAPELVVMTNRFEISELLRGRGMEVCLSDFDFSALPQQSLGKVVYRVAKERPLVHHCINASFQHLLPGGTLHLLGAKEDGIRTHGRNAEQVFATPEHAKKHGDSYRITLTKAATVAEQAEVRWLDSKDYAHLRNCTVGDFHFLSKPGVFGWNKVDQGSALLVEHTRQALKRKKSAGKVLDLGCGYGYLLLATADLPFSARWATDNNAAAVLAAQAGFTKQGLEVNVTLDDCGAHLEERFDLILCNPPFHQGFSTSQALAEKFLTQIRRLLADNGQALLVVNQFIPLERLAAEQFQSVNTLTQQHGFKIVQLG
jgi:16S rRNA (guanine1207-N2)-methyltransferase